MTRSRLELLFARHVRDAGLSEPETEYRFHPTRRWRFDFAWPERKLAVEVEGGVWTKGRHTRGSGFIADCEKYAEAQILGWRVLRMPGAWVQSGMDMYYLQRLIEASQGERT